MSQIRIIFSSAALFSGLSLLPKVLGILKDVVVAATFGASHSLDIYLLSFVLIGVPVSILVVAVQTVLIPKLINCPEGDAASLVNSTLKWSSLILLVVLPIWLLIIPELVGIFSMQASKEGVDALSSACRWLAPYYFFNGINLIIYGALQARKIFWPNAILPGLFPLALLITIFLMSENNLKTLLLGTILGSFIELLILAFMYREKYQQNTMVSISKETKNVFLSAVPLIFGGVVMALGPVIEQMIAYRLGEGAVSLLNYGNRIPTALNNMLITAIGIVVLPHFTSVLTDKSSNECKRILIKLSVAALFIGGLLILPISLYAEQLMQALFERGKFSNSNAHLSSSVMRMYLIQLPMGLVGIICLRLLAAMGKTKAMTILSSGQVVLGLLLAYSLSQLMGIKGIALGSSIASIAVSAIFFVTAYLCVSRFDYGGGK